MKECMPAFVLSGRNTNVFNEFDDKDYCEDFVKEFTCDADNVCDQNPNIAFESFSIFHCLWDPLDNAVACFHLD